MSDTKVIGEKTNKPIKWILLKNFIKKKGVTNETKHPVGVTKIRLKSR